MPRFLISLFFAVCAFLLPARGEAPADPAGHWEGTIQLPTVPLAIHVDLERKDEAWAGVIDIPAQGLRGFQLQPVAVDGTGVQFAMPKIPGDPAFSGKWDKTTGTIAGEFKQGGAKFPFKLERRERPAAAAGATPAKGIPGEGLAGHWQGSLQPTPVMELRLALEITKTPAGTYQGVMISLDQGTARIPITDLTETAGAVAMKIASVGGTFDGKFTADGSEISGEWQQGGGKLPLTFKRLAKEAALHRPQEPKKPYPYAEEIVAIKNEGAGITLAGTLTLPPGAGPHPAVVLLTGSGPQDRDEALMGHRPFLVLADHLTRTGIAVLRCDDRGVGASTGDFGQASSDDFVADALAAAAWLKTRPEIDHRRIGLLGHSEGGITAPLAAVKQPDTVAFIVMLAGVGIPMDELLVQQATDIGRVMGLSAETTAKNAILQRAVFAKIKESPDAKTAEKEATEIVQRHAQSLTAEERSAVGLTDAMISEQSKLVATPWFRKLIAYDPRPTLRQVKCPVLAVNGSKDLQVAAQENLGAIRTALTEGGNERVKIVEFPGLNHLFQTCTTGAMAEYSQIEETMAPVVLETVSAWIREQTTK